jgi:hypothetical protein
MHYPIRTIAAFVAAIIFPMGRPLNGKESTLVASANAGSIMARYSLPKPDYHGN